MSFILDALKKSQASRQRQTGPGIITVETAPGKEPAPGWVTTVIAILVLNLLVLSALAWWIARDKETVLMSTDRATAEQASATAAQQAQNRMGPKQPDDLPAKAQAADRPAVRPLSAEVREPALQEGTGQARTAAAPPPAVVTATPSEDAGFLPTLAELQLDQRIQLSPLHVDVHVYNENPQRRFVLINARKYKEGERLSEGPLLEEIRRDGLVMYYRDQRFLVPRD